MSIDADSIKFLDDVKKGKPRKFAMLCKGISIIGLKVYKKGPEESYKKELKKTGKGQFYGGVITGKGERIVFQLLFEQCEKPPTKDLTLKDFLSEAGLKFKPTYEIVSELAPISQADDETNTFPADAPNGYETQAAAVPDARSAGPDLAERWKTRSAALAVNLRKLKAGRVDLAKYPKIPAYFKGGQEFAKRGEYQKAHRFMDEIEKLIAEALRDGRPSSAGGEVAQGRVKKQIYLIERWKPVPAQLDTKVNLLRPVIGNELTTKVSGTLQALMKEIDQSIQKSVDKGAADFAGAIAEIRGARERVQSDELIRHLEAHPTISNLGVKATFLDALSDLEIQLAS